MPVLRSDARAGGPSRRAGSPTARPDDRARAARRRAFAPLALAPLTVGLAAAAGVLAGLPVLGVLGLTLAVAAAGGALAHRTVASVLAGVVLLLARPFAPGDRLRLPVPELGGETEAVVLSVGLVTTTLATGSGLLVVRNSRLLRA